MQTMFRLTALALLLSLSTLSARKPVVSNSGSPQAAVTVTIIYDNYQDDATLGTDWGFACLVEYQENQLLFDAGRSAVLFQKNVKQLEIRPEEIPSLFISHAHGDHTAGIPWIIETNPSIKVFLPATFATDLKASGNLPPNSSGYEEATHLYGPFYTTGDGFKAFREQGLVIKTENGGVLVTGCGHPGAVEMVSVAREKLGIDVHTVIGGLHLLQMADDQVLETAKKLQQIGVRRICPTHCTGDRAIALFKDSFGEGYISGGTGKKLVIN